MDEDVRTLGFDPKLIHPRNLIITALPVLPPCDRPYVNADNKVCDDDLTNQYIDIIKANNNLSDIENKKIRQKDLKEISKQRALANLKFRVASTFDNSKGKAKHTANGRAIKGIKERLAGKEGQIRNNMMGKRSVLPDTPIFMWSGDILPAKNISIGDEVIGDDGHPRTVLSIVNGTSKLYKVYQEYGDSYGISNEHILSLKYPEHGDIKWVKDEKSWTMGWYDKKNNTLKTKKILVVARDDDEGEEKEQKLLQMIDFKATINTDKIIDIHVKDYLSLESKEKLKGVKINQPIQWKCDEVKTDPRILGMWIAWGGYSEYPFANFCKSWGDRFRTELHIPCCKIFKLFRESGIQVSYYTGKNIPTEYIIASEKIRRLFLAGMIDAIGKIKNNYVEIYQRPGWGTVLSDTYKMAISLGLQARRESESLLTIHGIGLSLVPTLLPSSKCSPLDSDCYDIRIEEDGVGKFCGFQVDGNNRFLLGDTTITHNCDYTARTVIGPDPTLNIGELAMPVEMASVLTIPVRVASFNIDYLQDLVDRGKVNSLCKPGGETMIDIKLFQRGSRLISGDIIHRGKKKIISEDGRELILNGDMVEREGEMLPNIKPSNRKYKLLLGWTANRHIMDGDYVLLNRQPTLHKASMLSMKVKIKPNKTLRMNLAITKPFNADFDKILCRKQEA